MTFPAHHITISIERSAQEVYAFAANPANLPRWAAGLAGGIRQVDDIWIADSPMGEVQVRFAEINTLGVLDHDVTLPDGQVFSNPMRVFPNGDGSEVVFTLFRRPDMNEEKYAADLRAIQTDLQTLKTILES